MQWRYLSAKATIRVFGTKLSWPRHGNREALDAAHARIAELVAVCRSREMQYQASLSLVDMVNKDRAKSVEERDARIAELEAERDKGDYYEGIEEGYKTGWNAALEAAVDAVQENIFNLRSPDPDGGHVIYARDIIRALMKKEVGSDA